MSFIETFPSEADHLFQLGLRSAAGSDGPVDFVTAHKWFNLASALGHDGARRARSELACMMTASDLAEALVAARSWLRD